MLSTQCVKCDDGYFSPSSCLPCPPDCATCSSAALCETCVIIEATPKTDGSGECECPQFSTSDSTECLCDSGFFDTISGVGLNCECKLYLVPCPSDSSYDGSQCVCDLLFYEDAAGPDCQPCHSDCATCNGPTTCLSCKTTDAEPDVIGCSCPVNSILNTGGTACVCDNGFFDSLVGSGLSCGPCHSDCATCTDGIFCIVCVVPGAVPSTTVGGCECPIDSTFNIASNECECDALFYDDNTGSDLDCQPCHSDCSECIQADDCMSCVSLYAVPNGSGAGCVCPSNSALTLDQSKCECSIGFYEDVLGSVLGCLECHVDCKTCDQADICALCKLDEAVPVPLGPGCSCPGDSVAGINTCICEEGLYDSVDGGGISCVECHEDCKTCNNADFCLSCNVGNALIVPDTQGCVCPDNSSVNNTTSLCECDNLHFEDTNGDCLPCHIECSVCDNKFTCIECRDSNATVNGTIGCDCPLNSVMSEWLCVCDDFFVLSTESEAFECLSNFTTKSDSGNIGSEEFSKVYESTGALLAVAALVTVYGTGLVLDNPNVLWGLLNTIQILSLIPLLNVDIPNEVESYFKTFEISSFIPNLVNLISVDSPEESEIIPIKWRENGFVSTSIFYNAGECIMIFAFFTGVFLILVFLFCVAKVFGRGNYVKSKLTKFRYNAILRLWIEIYLDLTISSIISIHALVLGDLSLAVIFGSVLFVLCCLTPIGTIVLLQKLRTSIYSGSEDVWNRYSSLFYEFDVGMNGSVMFYVYFFFRRLGLVIVLYTMQDYTLLQTLTCLAVLLIYQYFHFTSIQFKGKWTHWMNTGMEISALVTFILLIPFHSTMTESMSIFLQLTIVGISCFSLGFYYIFAIGSSIYRCIRKKKNQIHNEATIGIIKQGSHLPTEGPLVAGQVTSRPNRPNIAMKNMNTITVRRQHPPQDRNKTSLYEVDTP